MRILHISDTHIGAKLGRYSQNSDIKKCLDHVRDFCVERKVALVAIAGDIFDSYNPSGESEDIYYNFLEQLSASGVRAAIIAGNHDNHERLNAPAAFLKRHDISVSVNNPQNNYAPLEINIDGEKISVVALPYIYDAQVSGIAEAENEIEASQAYSKAYNSIIASAAAAAEADIKILIAHAFFRGAIASGSERNIQRGGSLAIDASSFAAGFSYCAFGHLHRHQRIAENAFYSGSIIPISIDEAAYKKKMILIDTAQSLADKRIEIFDIPSFSVYKNLCGGFDEIYSNISGLKNAYISIVFNEALTLDRQDALLKAARAGDVKIVSQGFDIRRIGETGFAAPDKFLSYGESALFEEYLKAAGCFDQRLAEKFRLIADSVKAGDAVCD